MRDPNAMNYGMIPAGCGDGGTPGVCQYSNVLWNMAGLAPRSTGRRCWEETTKPPRGKRNSTR